MRGANKRYGDFVALDNVDFEVPAGSLTALLGPSGSGKSTLLRAIAGLDQPDTGTITINGRDVTRVPPQRRDIGFVFQHYAAFKHLTVRDNVAFGLKIRKRPKAEIAEKVDNLLEVVGLSGFQTRYPSQLSGGQRQRMALARALAVDPQVLLLDEPFGALDAKVREDLRAWLRRLHDEVHVTTVLVTHDQAEALDVADRIAVLNEGRIEQVGSPTEVYDTPANAFVMSFLGAVSSLNGALVRPHDIRVGRNPDMAVAADDGTARVRRRGPCHHRPRGDAGLRGAGGADQRRDRRPVHRPDHPRRRRGAGIAATATPCTCAPPGSRRSPKSGRGDAKPTRRERSCRPDVRLRSAAMCSAVAASKRSSTVSATSSVRAQRRCHRDACVLRRMRATRSVSSPGARNHGAITTRRAPRRRSRSDGLGRRGPDPVANAVVAPAHWVPPISLRGDRRCARVGRRRVSSRWPPRPRRARGRAGADAQLGQSLDAARDTSRSSSPSTSACRTVTTQLRRSARDVDAGVVGVGQQQRSDHRCVGAPAEHVGQARRIQLAERDIGRRGLAAAQRTGRRRPAHWPPTADPRCRVRSARGWSRGVQPAFGLGQPCQRPLRGSAPSTGLAVHGAQPIDG